LPLAASVGASPLATTSAASPLAVAIGDCAETAVAYSKKQNNVGKMILMGKNTTVQFRGAWALELRNATRTYPLVTDKETPHGKGARVDQLVPHPRDSPSPTLFCFVQDGINSGISEAWLARELLEV